ncbi:MAG: hypothetical protein NT031_20130 [Planctomycetota bacterium]|nr:hypothetical protein [Planctomycetota bacterium]
MNTVRHFGVAAVLAAVMALAIGCDEPDGGKDKASSQPATDAAVRVEPQPPLPVAPAAGTGAEALPPVVAGPWMGAEPGAGSGTPSGLPGPVMEQAKAAHDQSAQLAVGQIRSLVAAKQFDRALAMASAAALDYADTPSGGDLARLVTESREGRAGLPSPGEQAARHARFLQAREAGLAAMGKPDYAAAAGAFQAALQEEDDPGTRAMFQQASNLAGKPRLAVAEFTVAGDVGIPDAGKIVPELMLGQFDARRFQRVDRSRLTDALNEQKLTPAQIDENPKLLAVKRIAAVRYVVLGTVSRLGTLAVSARLVDTATGDIVQTADVTAWDAAGLQDSLVDLVAMLQMSDREKADYVALKGRQADAATGDDPGARAAAEAQRQAELEAQRQRIAAEQAEAFANTQHQRAAQGALVDIQGMLARGDFAIAVQLATWAQGVFADTPLVDQFGELSALAGARQQEQLDRQADAQAWARYQAELAARHGRYLAFRQQGMDALAANDVPAAAGAFQGALKEQDDPNLRALLDSLIRRMQRPAIAVADFDVRGDVGLPRRFAGAMLADALLKQFSPDDPRFRPLPREELLAELARAGLTMADLMRNPLQPRLQRIGVRYVIVGSARPGSIILSTVLWDLIERRAVSSADLAAANRYALPRAMSDLTAMLMMTPADRQAYLAQLAWTNWLARGDAAAAAGRWEEALTAYRTAAGIRNTQDLAEKIAVTSRKMRETVGLRRDYEAAMAAADAAARAGDWGKAADAYQKALALMSTPEARAGFDNARARLLKDAQQRHRLYQQAMASGEAAAKAGDWARALTAYQQAMELEDTPAARAAVALAKGKILDAQQAHRRDYQAAMVDARNAMQAGNWTQALAAYTRAGEIENTREAAAGIATARAKLAQQLSDRRVYETAMAQALAAIQAGDWNKALDAYLRADKAQSTRESLAGIATAKTRLAEGQAKQLYDAAMTQADAFARAGRWADALQAYQKAQGIMKTRESAAGILEAKQHLADAAAGEKNKAEFQRLIRAGDAHAAAGNWQQALTAYEQAAALQNTQAVQTKIAAAKKHLAEAAAEEKGKAEYQRLIRAGDAAAAAGNWQEALTAYEQAARVDNTRAVQTKIAAAKKHLTEAAGEEKAHREYQRFMTAGDAAAKDRKWPQALTAYTRAAGIENTPEAQAGMAAAKAKLAEAAGETTGETAPRREYAAALAAAKAATAAKDWPAAIAAWQKLQGIENTHEAQDGLTKAIAGAYAHSLGEAKAAAKAKQWQTALDAYTAAYGFKPTDEAQKGIADMKKKLGQ